MVQTASLGGRRDMFFLCFCINNWRSIQRNLFCLPMRCKMLHETQSLEWPEAFKWALLHTPHELDREQRGGPWPPWGPLPVWRRRLYAAGLNEFWGGNDPGRSDQTFLFISFDVADVARQGLQGLELNRWSLSIFRVAWLAIQAASTVSDGLGTLFLPAMACHVSNASWDRGFAITARGLQPA